MPRKAPDQVIEHRIALSNFERTQLLEQIEKNRENKLYQAGLSQVGSVLGSGVLLWGIGAYLGYGIFSSAYNKVSDIVNATSSGLADILNPEGQGNYSEDEAYRVSQAFNSLDRGIVAHRNAEQANSAASAGAIARLRNGDITLDEFRVIINELSTEADELDQLRIDLIYSRNVVTYIRNEFNQDRGGIPAWFTADYLDLIEACKGYPTEGTNLVYPS